MSHYVYIIYSGEVDKYYVGETVNPKERVRRHNVHFYESASTKIASDWKLFLTVKCESRSQALLFERFIKRMKSRKFYYKLKTIIVVLVIVIVTNFE